jgi:hypothetical protein
MVARLDVERARLVFGGKVGFQRFLEGLADAQRVELLQVRVAAEER